MLKKIQNKKKLTDSSYEIRLVISNAMYKYRLKKNRQSNSNIKSINYLIQKLIKYCSHIVSHNKLFYCKSIKNKTFKKCWALENLRLCFAKQNTKDNDRRQVC